MATRLSTTRRLRELTPSPLPPSTGELVVARANEAETSIRMGRRQLILSTPSGTPAALTGLERHRRFITPGACRRLPPFEDLISEAGKGRARGLF